MLNMDKKIENLRALVGDGVTYDVLDRLTYHNPNVPSISTLRNKKLLTVVREVTYEEILSPEKADSLTSEELTGWDWDDDIKRYIYIGVIRYYGIK